MYIPYSPPEREEPGARARGSRCPPSTRCGVSLSLYIYIYTYICIYTTYIYMT